MSLTALVRAGRADSRFAAIDRSVNEEIAAHRIPGAVVLVGLRGRTVYRAAFGALSIEPQPAPMPIDAIFDLASLTKVVATTPAVMQLIERGRLRLDATVASHWPEFGQAGKAAITLRQLLTHTAGLRADLDPAAGWSGPEAALALIAGDHPVCAPGTRFLYSDVGFIVLGELVRRVSGMPLDLYSHQHIFVPLRMRETGFRPAPDLRARIAPTDWEDGVLRHGAVQDPTAYRMAGVAGHAGLFASADDLARFAQAMLDGGGGVLTPDTVATMTRANPLPGGARRGLGWDIGSHYAAPMAEWFGPRAYGHTGYTGTLLWLDPDSATFLIVLTSRLHPDGRGDVQPLRAALSRIVATATGSVPACRMMARSGNVARTCG